MSYQDILRQQLLDDEKRRENAYRVEAGEDYAPKDEEVGFIDTAADVGVGIVSGVAEAAEGAYDMLDYATGDFMPDWDVDFGERKTVWGRVAEGAAEIGAAFIPVAGWVSRGGKVLGGIKTLGALSTRAEKAAKIAKARAAGLTGRAAKEAAEKAMEGFSGRQVVRGIVSGAIGDNIIFTKDEENLSALLTQFPGLQDSVASLLAVDEDDSELVQRLKVTVEGAGLGLLFEPIAYGINRIRAGRAVRASNPGATSDEIDRAVDEAVGPPPEARVPDAEDAGQLPLFPEADPVDAGAVTLDMTDDEIVQAGFNAEQISRDLDELIAEEASRIDNGLDDIPNPRASGVKKADLIANVVMRNGINLDRIGSDASVNTLVRAVESVLNRKDAFRIAGTDAQEVMDDAAKWFAERHNMDMGTAAARLLDGVEGDDLVGQAKQMLTRVTSLKAFYGSAAGKMKELMTKHQQGLATLQDKYDLLRAYDMMMRTTEAYSDIKSFFGKGLATLRRDSYTNLEIPREFVDAADMEQVLRRAGGERRVDELITRISALSEGRTGDELAGALTRTMEPTWFQTFGEVHEELWLNNLIGAPKTLFLATTGYANAYWKGIQRTLGAALDAADAYLLNTGNKERIGQARKELYAAARYDYELTVGATSHFINSLIYSTKSFVRGKPILANARSLDAEKGGLTADNISKLAGGIDMLKGDRPLGKILLDRGLLFALKVPNRLMTSIDEGAKQFQARATASAKLAMEYEDKVALGAFGDAIPSRGEYIKGRMDTIIREGQLYSKSRVYEDMLAKAPAELGDDAKQRWAKNEARRIYAANKNDSALAEFVGKDALDSAFQTPLARGGRAQAFDNLIRKTPAAYMIAPFRKTPINILTSAMQHIDFLSARKLANNPKTAASLARLKEGNSRYIAEMTSGDPMQRSQAIGRLASGAGLLAYAMNATEPDENGQVRMTGRGPADRKLRDLWIQSGNQPYSIRIGDGWYSYQRIDPFATLLGIVADFKDYARFSEDTPEQQETLSFLVGQTMKAASLNVVEKSYLMGFKNFMDVLDADAPQARVDAFVRNMVASHVPNIVGGPVRETNEDLVEIRNVLDALMARTPGLGEGLEPRRNILGEPIKATGSAFGQEPGSFADFFMPVAYTEVSDDLVMKEFAALGHRFTPPRPERNGLDWSDVRRGNQSAYDYWLDQSGKIKLDGMTLRQRLKKVIKSDRYQAIDPSPFNGESSPRVALLQQVLGAYRQAAKAQTYKRYPELLTNERLRTVNNALRAKGLTPIELKR
jgi:hypothetical protein